MNKPVYEINPLEDPRWPALLKSHPRSSVFHTPEWLEALRRTYHYSSRVFTTNPAGAQLTNGIVFCQVNSWLTGSKLISLPFSDHCEPLLKDEKDTLELLHSVHVATMAGKFKYAEIRPRFIELDFQRDFAPHSRFHLHVLDLRPGIGELYSNLHKNCIQRKIRRAEREHVVVVEGRSDLLLEQFYELLLLTRRRHRLPPQPLQWFRNLVECFGARLTIRVARVNSRPIASILTLRHKQTIVYKYGCSDERFHNLGGMPLLFWQAIQEAKREQLEEFDLGRSEQDNPGLVQFKDHLGATMTFLNYWRLTRDAGKAGKLEIVISPRMQSVLSHLPDRLFRLAGEIFYRHAG